MSLSSSCLGWPKTASTISFIRSSSVFFRSAAPKPPPKPSCSLSLPVELSRCGSDSAGSDSDNEIVCGEESDDDRDASC